MTTKILVVDDEKDLELLIKQKFRQKIRNEEFKFVFAEHGRQALEVIKEHKDVDLVLSDINMPVMDGLTLLSKLQEENRILKAVIISAYGDIENIRTAMNRGAFDFITKPIDFKDLEITIDKTLVYVAEMKKNIQAMRENDILKMYVDETVINFLGNQDYESNIMTNETIEGSVMFIDVCGFTKISESVQPDQVVRLINTYFDVIVKEIIAQDGLIDKFIGDAVMAVFRGKHHLDRAIDAALAVRNAINHLPTSEENIAFNPKVSIGIKSGEMISGNIGSASLRRLDFTVIGDTVNTAARIQDAADENQILISQQCYEQVKESFQCKKLDSIQMKNKAEPLIVYEVIE